MIRPSDTLMIRLRKSRLYILLAPALTLIFISLPGINQGDFRTDSHVYLAIVQEMLRSGDWIHLTMGNVPYHNKPPIGFWVVAPFVWMFGPTLFAVRLGMIVVAALCAIAVTGLSRELTSARVALTAGIVFALTHEVFRYTHAFSLDLTLMLFMVLSVWCIVHAAAPQQTSSRSAYWILLGGLPMGLALLTKPFLALLVLVPMTAWLIMIRRSKLTPWILGLVCVALGVALPWHLEMHRAYPRDEHYSFVDTYLFSQSLDRLSSGSQHMQEPPWYYFSELAQSYIPWIIFLVIGLAWLVLKRQSITKRWKADAFALLWMGVWIAVISLSAGKSMRYMVPVYPAMALIVAGVLVHSPPRGRMTPFLLPWVIGIIALIAGLSGIKIHSPAPEYREEMFSFIDSYSDGSTESWPTVWIAPDQLAWAAHFSIHRGFYPHVAMSEHTPEGGHPAAGELMLYRNESHFIPRPGDIVLGEFGHWVVTRLEHDWDGAYATVSSK